MCGEEMEKTSATVDLVNRENFVDLPFKEKHQAFDGETSGIDKSTRPLVIVPEKSDTESSSKS